MYCNKIIYVMVLLLCACQKENKLIKADKLDYAISDESIENKVITVWYKGIAIPKRYLAEFFKTDIADPLPRRTVYITTVTLAEENKPENIAYLNIYYLTPSLNFDVFYTNSDMDAFRKDEVLIEFILKGETLGYSTIYNATTEAPANYLKYEKAAGGNIASFSFSGYDTRAGGSGYQNVIMNAKGKILIKE